MMSACLHLQTATWFARAKLSGYIRLNLLFLETSKKAVLDFVTVLHMGSCTNRDTYLTVLLMLSCLTFCVSSWIFCAHQAGQWHRSINVYGYFQARLVNSVRTAEVFQSAMQKGAKTLKVNHFLGVPVWIWDTCFNLSVSNISWYI